MNKELLQAVETVIETMKQDYIDWSTQNGKKPLSSYHKDVIDNWKIEIKEGRNYINLIKYDHKSPISGGSTNGFIVKKATKGFVEGDMLKAAGYNAPATNFKRGNVFTDAKNKQVASWTGIQ